MKKNFYKKLALLLYVAFACMMPVLVCKAEEMTDMDQQIINATDIELDGYEDELMVGESMSLTATVIPEDATDTKVTYKSSDTKIATVKTNGTVHGVTHGNAIIYVTSGNITKELPITVKVKTKAININSQYVVMQTEEQFKLEATVVPETADKKLTYKSMDTDIATVSDKGIINAKACGSTTVTVSNGYMQVSVVVVVNESGDAGQIESEGAVATEIIKEYPDIIDASECALVTSDMLKYYYENKKNFTINGDRYSICVNGSDILNCENELNTQLQFKDTSEGISFEIKDKLCGVITLDISDMVTDEQYLYIFDDNKEKYQELKTDNIKKISLDTPGKYLITDERLLDGIGNMTFIVVGIVAIFIGTATYIIVKKRYLFW